MDPPPSYLKSRLEIWDRVKAKYDSYVESQEKTPIVITLPDGKQVEGSAWQTTPYEVAKGIRCCF